MFHKFTFILLFFVIKINANIKNNGIGSGYKMFVNKCCPMNQYVGQRKQCMPLKEVYSFSDIQVYDDDMNKVDKSFDEVLTLAPGKFEDEFFKMESVDVTILDYNTYVLHNGDLKLEVPNAYVRWIPVPNGNYCIDYRVVASKPSIRYWFYTPEDEINDDYQPIYVLCGMLVSCFFMLLVLIVYCLLPELRNLCGMILMATIASLLLAFLFLVTIVIRKHTREACIGLTLVIYFFFLSSFCWMTVMSFDIWWTFRGYLKSRPTHRRGENCKFLTYCIYAYGVPLAMTILTGVLNSLDLRHYPWLITPHVAESHCFLDGGYKFLYLYIPMLILIISNWMFYVMTALNVWQWSRGSAMLETVAAGNQRAQRRQKNRFLLYLKLSVVMGLMYVFEIISFGLPGYKIWFLIDAYNILIGFALFLIFVCKRKILRKLRKRFADKNFATWYISKSYSSSASHSNQEALELKICSNPPGNETTEKFIRK